MRAPRPAATETRPRPAPRRDRGGMGWPSWPSNHRVFRKIAPKGAKNHREGPFFLRPTRCFCRNFRGLSKAYVSSTRLGRKPQLDVMLSRRRADASSTRLGRKPQPAPIAATSSFLVSSTRLGRKLQLVFTRVRGELDVSSTPLGRKPQRSPSFGRKSQPTTVAPCHELDRQRRPQNPQLIDSVASSFPAVKM